MSDATKGQGEPVAWLDPAAGLSWLVDRMTVAPGTKLYTHADPGEVERLRAEVAKLRGYCVALDSEKRELEHKMDAYKGAAEQAVTLRAQLAELDALLRQCGNPVRAQISRLEDEARRSQHPKLYRDEVERLSVILRQMDALSASAQLSEASKYGN